MHWRNSARRYGLLSILLHWGVALTVFGLFGLGLWMAELDLFNPWYRRAPACWCCCACSGGCPVRRRHRSAPAPRRGGPAR